MLWTSMDDEIKVILLIHSQGLLPYFIRLIRRMRNMDAPTFWTEELS
jgi:hypothetical protein